MWKKDQVVVKAVLVLYGSQPVTRRVWKSVGAVVLVLYGSQPVTRRAWKSVPSPTSDVSFEVNQAGSLRIMSVGLEPAKTRDGNVACVPHLLRGH